MPRRSPPPNRPDGDHGRFKMEIIGFVAFFALVLAWLAAPNGDVAAMPVSQPVSPKLTPGEAPA